jgi:hypothetical protein
MNYSLLENVVQRVIVGIGAGIVIIYTVVKFLDEKIGIDIFKGIRERNKKKEEIKQEESEDDEDEENIEEKIPKNIQDLMHCKLQEHNEDIDELMKKLLNETESNRAYLIELVNDINLPIEEAHHYNLLKMYMAFEHCYKVEPDSHRWQGVPVGYMNGLGVELYNKRFGIFYVDTDKFLKDYDSPEKFPYTFVGYTKENFIIRDLKRQGCNIMFNLLLCYGGQPYALIGIDFNNEKDYLTTKQIEAIREKMFDAAFIISRERYGKVID